MKIRNTGYFANKNFYSVLAVLLILMMGNLSFGTGTVYVHEDFENTSFPPGGWLLSNTSGYNFVRSTYCSGYGNGISCFVADFYDYSSGNFELTTSGFPATTSGDSLMFDHAYAPATNENDRLEIYTSSDNGSSWTLLTTLLGGASGPLKTAPATWDLFVPTSSQWATKSLLLPVGSNKVKFTAISGYGNNLYLDNVRIGVPYVNDAGLSSITQPKWAITPQSSAPKATVRNYGTSSRSFQVTMTISPGGYSNSQTSNTLAPGETQTITFNNFNFALQGTYTLTAYTSLSGDQNSSNDTISNSLIVTTSPRNIVLEFCTGTWCQWCPCGEDEVLNVHNTYPNSVILAYHGAGTDPWRTFNGNGIISMLGFPGYPSGLVDRRLGNHNGWGSFFTDAEYRLSQSPGATVSIEATNVNYNPTSRQLTVNLNATALTNLSGQYKVNYVITEDNLVYPQTGNSWCPGNSAWEHDWIVRNIVNTVSGDNVNSGTWNNSQVIPLTFNTIIDQAWNAANCKFHVFIFKDNGALNVSEIQQGESFPIVTTGVNQSGSQMPDTYRLSQNYPNPFNPVTNIHFSIPEDGNVSLKIYDMTGKLVETYVDGFISAGNYNAEINASFYASGIYFYTLTAKDFRETKKMNLIK